MNICRKLAEMEYGKFVPGAVLALGIYRGYQYLVVNLCGWHPCGYVNVSGRERDLAQRPDEPLDMMNYQWINCHGGVTFAGTAIWPYDGGWWLGWDYAHLGDYMPIESIDEMARKHSTEEVVCECMNVINQICERLEVRDGK